MNNVYFKYMHIRNIATAASKCMELIVICTNDRRPIVLLVVDDNKSIDQFVSNFNFFLQHESQDACMTKNANVIALREPDGFELYPIVPDLDQIVSQNKNLHCLSELAGDKELVVVTTYKNLLCDLPPFIAINPMHIKCGHNKYNSMANILTSIGYQNVPIAQTAGDFAIRGSIIDIVDDLYGYRIDFIGNDIVSIKKFNVITQLTDDSADFESIAIYPVSNILLNNKTISIFNNNAKQYNIDEELVSNINQGIRSINLESYTSLFYDQVLTLYDYLSINVFDVFIDSDVLRKLQSFYSNISELKQIGKIQLTNLINKNHISLYEFIVGKKGRLNVVGDHFGDVSHVSSILKYNDIISPLIIKHIFYGPSNAFNQLIKFIKIVSHYGIDIINSGGFLKVLNGDAFDQYAVNFNLKILIGTNDTARLIKILNEHDIEASYIDSWKSFIVSNDRGLFIGNFDLSASFLCNGNIILAESGIFGFKSKRSITDKKNKNFFNIDKILTELNEFQLDEPLVHSYYGIGLFLGLETITVNNNAHDFIILLYDKGDKLFVPIEDIKLITKYNYKNFSLDKLGNNYIGWQQRKDKIREEIWKNAEKITTTAAQRKNIKSPIIISSDEMTEKFCMNFAHIETQDQLSAIDDIFADLSSGYPMDRLLCGDAGFGKTEVIMRAACATVANGYQVAVLTPTTLLANQHFKTFQDRFEGLPCTIGLISRLESSKLIKSVLNDIESGKNDIVIGTHALVKRRINFKRLGLLIIDEEHIFGVENKEHFKRIYPSLHVLSVSATPIPRTLYMSMNGLKDISLITTPPMDRLPVKTSVVTHHDDRIIDALINEKKRNGACFYVCPYISDLQQLHDRLLDKLNMSSISIGILNGQMSVEIIKSTLNLFNDGNIDILLSTSIIESGIDMPHANTIIIHKANHFGLSQLYQLKAPATAGPIR